MARFFFSPEAFFPSASLFLHLDVAASLLKLMCVPILLLLIGWMYESSLCSRPNNYTSVVDTGSVPGYHEALHICISGLRLCVVLVVVHFCNALGKTFFIFKQCKQSFSELCSSSPPPTKKRGILLISFVDSSLANIAFSSLWLICTFWHTLMLHFHPENLLCLLHESHRWSLMTYPVLEKVSHFLWNISTSTPCYPRGARGEGKNARWNRRGMGVIGLHCRKERYSDGFSNSLAFSFYTFLPDLHPTLNRQPARSFPPFSGFI